MQMLSRYSTRPENNKKFLKKKGNTFLLWVIKPDWFRTMCNASIYKTVLGLFLIFYCFRNWTAFSTSPSPPKQLYPTLTPSILNIQKKAKHRSDILKGLNIMQPVK